MWIVASLLAGLGLGLRNVLSKQSAEELPELLSMWFLFTFSLPLVVFGFFFQPFLIQNTFFWWLVLFRLFLDLAAAFTFYKALKFESVTVVIPLLALQPLLTLVTTFFINHQVPSMVGLLATMLVVIGLGVMYFQEVKKGERKDFYKSALLVGCTVLCYSFLEPIHAKAISYSNVTTYLVTSQLIIAVVLSALAFAKHFRELRLIISNKRIITINTAMGLALGLELVFLFSAFSLAENVAYVISLASINIVVTTLGAVMFLKERINTERYAAIGLITLASVLFAFA